MPYIRKVKIHCVCDAFFAYDEQMVQEVEKMRDSLTRRMSKEAILAFAETVNGCDCDKILPLIAEDDKELSGNAAYVLLCAQKSLQNCLSGHTEFIMEVVQSTPFEKSRRLLLSLLEKLPSDTTNINVKFLDYCIDSILSAKTPCAIKVSCMKLAFRQCATYKELLVELKMVLDTMDVSMLAPSVACARRNIMKKLLATLQ